MEQLVEEFGHPTFTPFPVIAARLLLAAHLRRGDRLRARVAQPAGRDCAPTYSSASRRPPSRILTIEIIHAPMFPSRRPVNVDPIRVVEAVTAGVAFLAAGVVIFTRGQVQD